MTMSSTQFLLFIVACIAISSPLKMRVPKPKTGNKLSIVENITCLTLTECSHSKIKAGSGDFVPRDVSTLQGSEAAN